MDYTIGFLFFMVTFFIVGVLLARTFLFDDQFDEVYTAANAASEHILSTGYPEFWRTDDIVIAGLLTNGKISMKKAQRLATYAKDSNSLRGVLNSRYDIAIILKNQQNEIIPLNQNCSIGSLQSQYTLKTTNKTIAYYAVDQNSLQPKLTALDATIYEDYQIDTLLQETYLYDIIVLEYPNLAQQEDPSQQQKANALESFVELGGDLIIIGNLNLTQFLQTTPTTQESAYHQANGSFFNLTQNITDITTAHTTINDDLSRYTTIASMPDATDFMAEFSIGDGDVHYLGSLDGTLNTTLSALQPYLEDTLGNYSRPLTANCTQITPPQSDTVVSIKRLAALDGSIITVEVLAWE